MGYAQEFRLAVLNEYLLPTFTVRVASCIVPRCPGAAWRNREIAAPCLGCHRIRPSPCRAS